MMSANNTLLTKVESVGVLSKEILKEDLESPKVKALLKEIKYIRDNSTNIKIIQKETEKAIFYLLYDQEFYSSYLANLNSSYSKDDPFYHTGLDYISTLKEGQMIPLVIGDNAHKDPIVLTKRNNKVYIIPLLQYYFEGAVDNISNFIQGLRKNFNNAQEEEMPKIKYMAQNIEKIPNLQQDSYSCNIYSEKIKKYALKPENQEELRKYVDDCIKETNKSYYPGAIKCAQSMSKLNSKEIEKHINNKFLAQKVINDELKTINIKLLYRGLKLALREEIKRIEEEMKDYNQKSIKYPKEESAYYFGITEALKALKKFINIEDTSYKKDILDINKQKENDLESIKETINKID